MTPTKHVFQSFWHGGAVSPYEKLCMKSFVDHGHSFHLYTFCPQLNVPNGIQLKSAADIIDQGEYFTYKKGVGIGSHAAFSNLFRYKLLAEFGGWWVDTDVVCLSSEVPPFEDFFARESDEHVNGAVLYFKRGDRLMLDCLKEAERIRDNASWGEIGPRLITKKLEETGRIIDAQPKDACYPIHHRNAMDVLRPSEARRLIDRIEHSLFLHLWNEIFRRMNISKMMLPPRGSLLREIADRHRVEGWCGEYAADFLEHAVNREIELKQLRSSNDRLCRQLSARGWKRLKVLLSHNRNLLKERVRGTLDTSR